MAEELITQFKVTYYDHPKAGKLAIMTMDNGADYKKPNTFGTGRYLLSQRGDGQPRQGHQGPDAHRQDCSSSRWART